MKITTEMVRRASDKLKSRRTKFEKVLDNQEVTPVMDGYLMKCCGCGLVHRMTFRVVKVTDTSGDGTFKGYELDPSEYRVSIKAERVEPSRNPMANQGESSGSPVCPLCDAQPGQEHAPACPRHPSDPMGVRRTSGNTVGK
jgi:hypothetical protein